MRKWKQRLFSLLLCAAMLFSLCMPASAVEGDVSFLYCDESGKNWKTGTCSTYKAVTEDTDEWKDSWYVAEGAVNIGIRVGVSGNVHLILKDSCELEAEYGITLYEGASLTIYAQSDGEKMGKLTARYSGSSDAGIKVNSGRTITINGGEVTAAGWDGAGIVSGYGDGTFGPNDPITREQLAVMLWRYSGSPAATKELYFNDTDEISGFALEALRWAVENGILNGDGGRLAPQNQATRAQAAQMLKSFIKHQEEDI